jgi:chromosome segregation ATPase
MDIYAFSTESLRTAQFENNSLKRVNYYNKEDLKIANNKINLLQTLLEASNTANTKLREELEITTKQRDKSSFNQVEGIEIFKAQIKELENQLFKVCRDLDTSNETSLKLATKLLYFEGNPAQGIVSPLVQLQEQVIAKDKEITKLNFGYGQLYDKINCLEANLKYKDDEISRLNKTIGEYKREPSAMLLRERQQHKGVVEELKNELEVTKKQLSERESENRSLKNQYSAQCMNATWKQNEINDAKKELNELEASSSAEIRKLVEEKQKNISHWQMIVDDLQQELSEKKEDLEKTEVNNLENRQRFTEQFKKEKDQNTKHWQKVIKGLQTELKQANDVYVETKSVLSQLIIALNEENFQLQQQRHRENKEGKIRNQEQSRAITQPKEKIKSIEKIEEQLTTLFSFLAQLGTLTIILHKPNQ